MSIRRRLLWLSTLWLVAVLLLFNVFIYSFFLHESTQSEIKLIWNRAQMILRRPEVHLPEQWREPGLLEEFLTEDSIIRIFTPESEIAAQVFNNEKLLDHPVVYRTGYHTAIENEDGLHKLYIQVPIKREGVQVGLLEIGKGMKVLNRYLGVLASALTLTTLSAVLFSIAGGYFYSRLLIRPLERMIRTMQLIEESGEFIRIGLPERGRHDELTRLAGTFDRMIDRLEANDARQRQFIEDASHELRTPLTVIKSYSSMLRRWAGDDPELRREAADAIYEESVRLKQLVNSLLQLAKDEQERQLSRSRTDIAAMVRSAAKSLSQAHRRVIRVKAEAEPLWVDVDREQIRQLLIILYDNALKYSRSAVDTLLTRHGGTIRLEVRDYGSGIPAADLPHIFERFYRVDRDRSRKSGGSGLGLSIARRIVQAHNGTIEAVSENGKGTSMIVMLPARVETEESVEASD